MHTSQTDSQHSVALLYLLNNYFLQQIVPVTYLTPYNIHLWGRQEYLSMGSAAEHAPSATGAGCNMQVPSYF